MGGLFYFMEWIEVFENYIISEYGNFKNKKTGRMLNITISPKGYKIVQVRSRGKSLTIRVHRTVYEKFIGLLPNKHEVNHIDGNKSNNHYSNLEAVTHHQNILHAVKIGLIKSGFDNKFSKPLVEFKQNGDIEFYGSGCEAGRKLKKHHALISLCANGKRRTAYGSKWMHISEFITLTDNK
jgi:hypothetical protein